MASPFIKLDPDMENNGPAGPSAHPSRPPLSEVQNKPDLPSNSYRHDEFKANKGINDASQLATGVQENPTTVNSTHEDLEQPQGQKVMEKIMELSEAAEHIGALMEWVFISCTKSSSNTGVCLCGKTNVRYLFHIKNIKNENEAQLGAHCLKHIHVGGDLESVLRTAETMFVDYDGMLVHFIAQQDDELKFQIDKKASILKYRTELSAMYPGGIPLDQDSLIAKAGCDEARQMIAGGKYNIRVKLYVDDDNTANLTMLTLKAEVIRATPMD